MPLGLACALLTGHSFAANDSQTAHKPLIHHALQSWNMDDGLPQPTVSALAQDHHGYIWLAVQAGLVRFDGARFVAFDSSNSLIPNERVLALTVDDQDRLWIGTQIGPARIDADQLIRADIQPLPGDQPVHQFLSLTDGSMAMASRGLPVIAPDGTLRHLLSEQTDVRALARSGDKLWVGSIGRIFHGPPDHLVALDFPPERAHHSVTGLAWWDEQLWIGTSSGLLRLDPVNKQLEAVSLPPPARAYDEAISLVESNDGLWIGTFHALFRVDENGGWDMADKHQFDDHPWVSSILRDREGHLWFGSQAEGLTRARRGWTRRYDQILGLEDNFVWSVALGPNNGIWLGTNTGVSVMQQGHIEKLIDAAELPNPSVYSLFRTRDGRVFLGTQSGLAIHDGAGVQLPSLPDELARAQVHSFLALSDGSVLIGASTGLYLEKNGLVEATALPGVEPGQSVRFLAKVNGAIWVGTDRGLVVPSDSGVAASALPDTLQMAMITGMLELDDEHWLIGTYRQGLYLFKRQQGWQRLDRSHGLYDDSAFSLTRDEQNRVWISSHIGLQQTTVEALIQGAPERDIRMVVSSGGREPGAVAMRCCNGAGHGKALLHEGQLWLPTLQGVIAVELDQVKDNPTAPTVIIEELQTRSGERHIDQHRVELPAFARHFRIHFTGLSYRDPRGVRFRYRIPGFDPDWSEPAAQRYADYTNLPAGEHVFEVIAANDSGLWSETPARLSIHVAPYWYEHPLSRASLALALVIAVLLLVRWRTARSERLRRVLARHVQQRTRELATANQRLDELNQELAQLSETDSLTNLRNRRFAMRQLQQDAQFYQRKAIAGDAPQVAMAFVLVDLDHFKEVNDQYGHAAGDAVLVEFARRARQISRDSDYLIRWGGEEFLMVLRETSLDQACRFADRLCRLISSEPFKVADQLALDISCSAGVSELSANPQCSHQWDRCIEVADFALYQAKADGRNRWCAIAGESVIQLLDQTGGIQQALLELQAQGRLELRNSEQL